MLVNNAATIGEIVPLDKKSEIGIIDEYNLNIIAPTIFCKKFIQSNKEVKKIKKDSLAKLKKHSITKGFVL